MINASTSLGAIYKDDVKGLNILIPPFEEQASIATALSDVDSLISALTKKIEKKKAIKQGLMQQLLTGKKRLPEFGEKWVEIELGQHSIMNSGGTPSTANPEYYGGKIPFLSINDITNAGKFIYETEKTITEEGLKNSSARLFKKGTIMYAMYASVGKCAITKIRISCSQAILGINVDSTLDADFLYYYLVSIQDDVLNYGQTGTQTNLSKQIISSFILNVPSSKAEQTAIANILSDCDSEIAALEEKRDKYKEIKQGMMQQLLTGKIRLIK